MRALEFLHGFAPRLAGPRRPGGRAPLPGRARHSRRIAHAPAAHGPRAQPRRTSLGVQCRRADLRPGGAAL
ncbi:hypothetical protein G6F61_015015 [Rhizopus arrhizus]|nr:hypothetical protein G6F61_015015 [Rhizopus arrhizus]